MIKFLKCMKCGKPTATLTYEEDRDYKVSCKCGYDFDFSHVSELDALCYYATAVELETYRKLEKEQRLLVLPCKIGTEVFVPYLMEDIDDTIMSGVEEMTITGFIVEEDEITYLAHNDVYVEATEIKASELYTTKEQAEAALLKMEVLK